MRYVKRIFFYSLISVFCSCQKVIELKLKNSDIKYVVEGIITNEPNFCKVYITRSKPFYEDNQFEGVPGAIVKVTDNGVEAQLVETGPGIYETNSVNGTPGHTYQLIVSVDNNTFTASSTMPQPVLLDDLYISSGPFGQFSFASIRYRDPAGVQNNYRFIQFLNGVHDPAIFWENDEFTDGQSTILQLDTGIDKKDDARNIKSGDTVTVEMDCIDAAMYKYWYSLNSNGGDGSGNSASPANPVTNLNGGALGYFSAHTVNRKTVIAP